MKLKLINRKDKMPEEKDGRILIFSPIYSKEHDMRFRIIDWEFFKFCIEATHWISLNLLESFITNDKKN